MKQFRTHVYMKNKKGKINEYIMSWRNCCDYTIVEILTEFEGYDYEIEFRDKEVKEIGSK